MRATCVAMVDDLEAALPHYYDLQSIDDGCGAPYVVGGQWGSTRCRRRHVDLERFRAGATYRTRLPVGSMLQEGAPGADLAGLRPERHVAGSQVGGVGRFDQAAVAGEADHVRHLRAVSSSQAKALPQAGIGQYAALQKLQRGMLVTGPHPFLNHGVREPDRREENRPRRLYPAVSHLKIRWRHLPAFHGRHHLVDSRALFFAEFHAAHERGECFVA